MSFGHKVRERKKMNARRGSILPGFFGDAEIMVWNLVEILVGICEILIVKEDEIRYTGNSS